MPAASNVKPLSPKASKFLIFVHAQRRVIHSSNSGTGRVYWLPEEYNAQAEQVIVFTVTAWDANCPKHFPARFEAAAVQAR